MYTFESRAKWPSFLLYLLLFLDQCIGRILYQSDITKFYFTWRRTFRCGCRIPPSGRCPSRAFCIFPLSFASSLDWCNCNIIKSFLKNSLELYKDYLSRTQQHEEQKHQQEIKPHRRISNIFLILLLSLNFRKESKVIWHSLEKFRLLYSLSMSWPEIFLVTRRFLCPRHVQYGS